MEGVEVDDPLEADPALFPAPVDGDVDVDEPVVGLVLVLVLELAPPPPPPPHETRAITKVVTSTWPFILKLLLG